MTKENSTFAGDQYWGRGGSYVVNPATGQREPVSGAAPDAQVQESTAAAVTDMSPVATDATATTVTTKEKRRGN